MNMKYFLKKKRERTRIKVEVSTMWIADFKIITDITIAFILITLASFCETNI
jgi:hypothetical protein